MQKIMTNSAGVDVFGGIQPDCRVDDTWQFALNSEDDPLTANALNFISNGVCGVATGR